MAKIYASMDGEELSYDLTKDVLPVSVFIAVEAFVGLFGNITVLLVYTKRYRLINFRYFVLALAFVDLTSCCTTLPGEVFSQLNWYDYQYAWICKVKSFFNIYTAWGSASVLLILSIDRFRKVCHPCNWQIRFTVAFRLCLCCLILSAIVSIPVFILWGKQTYIYAFNGNNVTVSVCEKSGEYAETIYPLLYITGVYLVPVSIMIVVAMVLNFITAWQLFGHHSMKETRIEHHSLKANTTISLTPETSLARTDDNSETKATADEGHRTEKVIRNESFNSSAKTQGVNTLNIQPTKFKTKPSNGRCIADAGRKSSVIENSSADDFSDDEEYTDDYTTEDEPTGNISSDQTSSDKSKRTSRRSRRSRIQPSKFHRKRKTLIMLILTSIFAVTMAIYIVLTSFVAKPDSVLKDMPGSQKAAFFFFWRLYFVNSVVNPILYGFMDPGFRSGFISYIRRNKQSVTSVTSQ